MVGKKKPSRGKQRVRKVTIRQAQRDADFSEKIKRIPYEWLTPDNVLVLIDEDLGKADVWKEQIYFLQHKAAISLYLAYTNQHPVGHKVKRNKDLGNQIVYSSQLIERAYHLRYCILLLQACGDKLAQLVRHALRIRRWKYVGRGKRINGRATEHNTTLPALRKHLKQNECPPKAICKYVNSYLSNKNVRVITKELANAIKHRWIKLYQGEGLQASKPAIKKIKNKSGEMIRKSVSFGNYSIGENIDEDIERALVTNNLFVDLCEKVTNELYLDRYHTKDKRGTRVLDLRFWVDKLR